jgi:hypothetical protein
MPDTPRAAAVLPLLCRPRLDASRAAAAAALLAELQAEDWHVITRESVKHRVAPLVYRSLTELSPDPGPGGGMDAAVAARQALAADHDRHAARNGLIGHVVREVVHIASTVDVPLVVRKGAHLALALYAEPGLRPMGDIDFLLPADAAERLVPELVAAGFAEGVPRNGVIEPLSRAERAFFALYGANVPQLHRMTGEPARPIVSLDLSTSVFLPRKGFHIPLEALLDRSTVAATVAGPLPVLSIEDTMLDLCVNLHRNLTVLRVMQQGKHRRLINFVDIMELARDAGFAWSTFLDRVLEYQIAEPVYVALAHVRHMFHDAVPEEVVACLAVKVVDPERLLRRYGQWDLPQPREWTDDYRLRCFDPDRDREIPASRSLL